jgi:hypothetical protein
VDVNTARGLPADPSATALAVQAHVVLEHVARSRQLVCASEHRLARGQEALARLRERAARLRAELRQGRGDGRG